MKDKTFLGNKANRKRLIAVVIIAALFSVPLVLKDQKYLMVLLTTTALNVIIASGLDILFGFSGQISMGHAAFYAMGAYGTAILSKTVGWNPWVTIIVATVASTCIAFLFALPVTKLVHMFLSLVTIALGEIVYQIIVNFFPDVTGGTTGFSGISKFSLFGFVIKERSHFLLLVLVFMVLAIVFKQMLIKSRVGRAFVAIRENPVAAGGMGINVRLYKAIAFAVSAFYTALAGALFAHFMGYISPETFTRATSTSFLTMVLFGGSGTVAGPILGAGILSVFSEMIQAFGEYQMLIYGVLIILVVLFAPQGLMGIINNVWNKIRGRRGEAGVNDTESE